MLNDGSRHQVFKRYLRPDQLAEEIDGQVLFDGDWFIGARAPASPPPAKASAPREPSADSASAA